MKTEQSNPAIRYARGVPFSLTWQEGLVGFQYFQVDLAVFGSPTTKKSFFCATRADFLEVLDYWNGETPISVKYYSV
jgi:hypothetical protein